MAITPSATVNKHTMQTRSTNCLRDVQTGPQRITVLKWSFRIDLLSLQLHPRHVTRPSSGHIEQGVLSVNMMTAHWKCNRKRFSYCVFYKCILIPMKKPVQKLLEEICGFQIRPKMNLSNAIKINVGQIVVHYIGLHMVPGTHLYFLRLCQRCPKRVA